MELDAVVKIGGSIIRNGLLRDNLEVLEELAAEQNIIAVTGGGELADAVRSFDDSYDLSTERGHWIGVKCIDLNTEMAEDVSSGAKTTTSEMEAEEIMEDDRLCLFKTRELLEDVEHPHSWDLTSDSIAAIVARELEASRLVIVTDVDGIFSEGKIVREIDCGQLEEMGETCVDPLLHEALRGQDLETTVVSGLHPSRVRKALRGEDVEGTRIC